MVKVQERHAEVIVALGKLRIDSDGLAKVLEPFCNIAMDEIGHSQGVLYLGVVWRNCQSPYPHRQSLVGVSLFPKSPSLFHQSIQVRGRNLNIFDCIAGNIDKLWDVDRTIRCGSIVDQNGGTVIALGIDMRKIHLGVWRTSFRGKDEPAAIR